MADLDPYAVLGVPRTASREDIARAYRRQAKLHHPDAGAPPSRTMASINEAWAILSSRNRRAGWDRDHTVILPPHWAAVPATAPARAPVRPPSPVAAGPPSVRDSGWLAILVVAGAAMLVGVVMFALAQTDGAVDANDPTIDLAQFRLEVPEEWRLFRGDGTDADEHEVLAHLVSYEIPIGDRCLAFSQECSITSSAVPAGEASLVITSWRGGDPPVPDPILARPYGLDAERMIGGNPAAFDLHRSQDGADAWWQLSPPGFPDRWIEVHAAVGGGRFEQDRSIREIDAMLRTLQFTDG
jgi:DnaJ domain